MTYDDVYTWALAYADDITMSCPSNVGINKMLKISDKFAWDNNIIIDSQKMFVLNYGIRLLKDRR